MNMSWALRLEMIALALGVAFVVVRSINKKKMRIQYSIVWMLLSGVLLVISLFPGIVFFLCRLLGIETASNLIFLLGIMALMLVSLIQTSIISKQADKIKYLTQVISIEKHLDKECPHHEQ